MATSINIDFEKLDKDIASIKALKEELDAPNYDKVEFWLSGVGGSGMVRDQLMDFCNGAITFHHGIVTLIDNTVSYLSSVKELKDKDQSIADKL